MDGVKIEVASFAVSGEHIFKHLQEQEQALSEIAGVIDSMEDVWESESQRVYTERFRDSREKIQDFIQSFREDFTNMEKYVRDWIAYDDWIARKLK